MFMFLPKNLIGVLKELVKITSSISFQHTSAKNKELYTEDIKRLDKLFTRLLKEKVSKLRNNSENLEIAVSEVLRKIKNNTFTNLYPTLI